jgi:tRNA(adenine34) deaminase
MSGRVTILIPDPMKRALALAADAARADEVPVGVVIVKNGLIVAEAGNMMRALQDPTAHAEMVAIRAAAALLKNERLDDCDLWVTLEPCAMCAGAIANARIRRLYYAASDPKGGAVEHGPKIFGHSTCLHKPEVYGGLGEALAAEQLRSFFAVRRSTKA